MLRAYLNHRLDTGERFNQFVRRHATEELKALFESSG
jgi:hypothetical protein